MTSKISFVCITSGDIDIINSVNLTMYSIIKNFNLNDIDKIYIITKNEEITKIYNLIINNELLLKYIKLFNILDEKNICDNVFNDGYRYQMILKLFASKIIKTQYYITLDSDIYLTKKISLNDLIIDNKPITNIEKMQAHYEWWEASNKIINQKINKNYNCIGVTPTILITNVVNDLLNKYENDILFSKKNFYYTEYSLYNLFINEKYNSIYELYYDKNLYNNCIWVKDNFTDLNDLKKKINFQFKNENTIFSLVQSHIFKNNQQDYNEIINYIINNI
jgi:hypothetical protein